MPKFFQISSGTLPLLAAVLVLSLSAGYFTLAWSEPSGTMPASVAAPINTGSIAQVKAGDLAIGSDAVKYWLTQSGQSFALKNNAGSIKFIVGQDGSVGIGTTAPGAKLDVQGQIIGGFGAQTTAGVLDWNDPSNIRSGSGYTLLMGNAASGPGPVSYFHTFNFEYNSKNGSGNITQLAIPYASPSNAGIYIRGRYSGSWSSWSQIGGGASSQWITSGSNIYYNTGNVGIGTAAPGAKLSFGTNYDTVGNNPTYNIRLYESGTTVYGFGVQSGTLAINANQASGKIVFNAGTTNDAPTTRMTILGSGDVGIGTAAPLAKLAVVGAGSSGVTTGSSGDAIAAYANSGNSALYAEQQNIAGYAGYFNGNVNITKNLSVGGNINATGTINSATAICVNSVCANSTTWNNIVIGAGSGGSGVWGPSKEFAFMGSVMVGGIALSEGYPVSTADTSISGWDPLNKRLIFGAGSDNYFFIVSKNEAGGLVYKRAVITRSSESWSEVCGIVTINEKEYSSYSDSTYPGTYGYCSAPTTAHLFQYLKIEGGNKINMNENGPLATDGTSIYLFSKASKDAGKKIYKYDQSLNALGTINLGVSASADSTFSCDGNYFYFYTNGSLKKYDLLGNIVTTYSQDLGNIIKSSNDQKDAKSIYTVFNNGGIMWVAKPLLTGSSITDISGIEFVPMLRQ